MSQQNHELDLHELLAARRNHMPVEADHAYFEGVVGQFHQHQMAEVLKVRQSFWGKVAHLPEILSQAFSFPTPVRFAIPAMAACLLLAFGVVFNDSSSPEAPALAALSLEEQENAIAAFAEDFGTSNALLAPAETDQVVSVDEIPHYVMAQAPSSVDAVVAF